MKETMRILLADDHPVVREGIAALIARRPDMTVVGEACNGQEAVELFRQHQPDIVLMDLRMPIMDGVEAIQTIHAECPTARILVLTTYDGDEDVYRALHAGAVGYLLKEIVCPIFCKSSRFEIEQTGFYRKSEAISSKTPRARSFWKRSARYITGIRVSPRTSR